MNRGKIPVKLIGVLFPIAVLFGLSSPLHASGWGELSSRLTENMTEDEVKHALGYSPNKVDLETCGGGTGRPYPCKVYTFGDANSGIFVVFQNWEGRYRVMLWNVYP